MGRKYRCHYLPDILLPTPSPYSPFDSKSAKSVCYSAQVKEVKGWKSNFHVYGETMKMRLDAWANSSREDSKRVKTFSLSSQRVFLNSSKTFSKTSSSFSKSPVKYLGYYFKGENG